MNIERMAQAWRRSSRDDLAVAKSLLEKRHYAHCLFFCHLAVEKELKRIYLLRQKEIPPAIHNLVRLAEKAGLDIDEPVRDSFQELTTFNIKARYEIIKQVFHRRATKPFAQKWIAKTEGLLAFLEKTA